jgi:murein tripeptide amidase MpaA
MQPGHLLWFPALMLCAAPAPAQIAVRTNFEGGNIGRVEVVSPAHLRCAVRGQADQDGRNRQANWYYFELANLPRGPVIIDLVNLAGEYNYRVPAYSVTKGTRPVYSYDGLRWTHFGDGQVEWDNGEPHLRLRFTPQRRGMWIAHVPPYTGRNLRALLAAFASSPYLQRQMAGRSVEGREIPLLSITDPRTRAAEKRVLWLMFRQHAWETGSSWVGEGAIRFLLSGDPRAAEIRNRSVFKIFPVCDPDGVASGAVRYNRHGYDLNRNWDTVDPKTMPEIAAQRKAVLEWVDGGHRLDLFLSLHNTESGEYLEVPAAFRALGERAFRRLSETTTFNPTSPLRDVTMDAARGRMTVDQGLFSDRKLPAMLMEQMVEYNSRLGRCPTAEDRMEFGAALVRALDQAVHETGAGK